MRCSFPPRACTCCTLTTRRSTTGSCESRTSHRISTAPPRTRVARSSCQFHDTRRRRLRSTLEPRARDYHAASEWITARGPSAECREATPSRFWSCCRYGQCQRSGLHLPQCGQLGDRGPGALTSISRRRRLRLACPPRARMLPVATGRASAFEAALNCHSLRQRQPHRNLGLLIRFIKLRLVSGAHGPSGATTRSPARPWIHHIGYPAWRSPCPPVCGPWPCTVRGR